MTLFDLKKLAKINIFIIACLSILFIYGASKLKFDYDFTSFYQDDEDTHFFDLHQSKFGTDNDFVFISIESESGVFNTRFLKQVKALVNDLSQDSLVESITCLTNMSDYFKTPLSNQFFKTPYINISDTNSYYRDSIKIFSRPELTNFFINSDATGLLIRVIHQPYLSKKKCDRLKASIDQSLHNNKITKFHYAGRAIGQSYYVDTMRFETLFFIGMSFLLVIVFLYFSFKSLWGIVLPLLIVSTSMLWVVGLMGLIGEPINIMLTVLPSIIFIVAMSDVIHLVSKYIEELRLGENRNNAIKIAYKEVGKATLLTSITTAIGFLSLLTIPLQPIKIFGIYTAIGVMISFVLAYTLLPALLILVKPPKLINTKMINNFWYRTLHKLLLVLIKKKSYFLTVFIGVIALAIFGFTKVESNYFMLEDLKKKNEMRQQFDFFDQQYMGLRPFELAIVVEKPDATVYDYSVLAQINKIDSFLVNDYGLNQTFSLSTMLKIANRTENGGQSKNYKFPNEKMSRKFLSRLKRLKGGKVLSKLVDSTETYTRISSTIGDIGKQEITKRNIRLTDFIDKNIDLKLINVRLTGTGHLLDKNMSTISNNLVKGLVLAILIVSLLMGILYRSLKMVLIALVPNVLPLVFLAAILGYAGIDLKVSTAIIFTIAFGIAVDDTIHFMGKYKLELNKGKSSLYALKRTFLSTGRAIVLTSLIICSGFLLLLFSDFLGTFYIGLLISLTLVFALLADLFLLPLLLIFFYTKKP